MTTHYQSSKGPLEIASMPEAYLRNARDKLLRDRKGGERQAEVDAMTARLDQLADEATNISTEAGTPDATA